MIVAWRNGERVESRLERLVVGGLHHWLHRRLHHWLHHWLHGLVHAVNWLRGVVGHDDGGAVEIALLFVEGVVGEGLLVGSSPAVLDGEDDHDN